MQQLINIWVGEQYKLLGALVQTINPKNIIEIGTYTGAMLFGNEKNFQKKQIS